ncbi:hypothetical protein [Paludisphaera soli]|uniref:hypothetical protein n=1 Tax=Paludisphaera soli TaxID=2712865 RepID=UPI0013ED6CD4|nr:hypothetical protein [Paludisphaera soli]
MLHAVRLLPGEEAVKSWDRVADFLHRVDAEMRRREIGGRYGPIKARRSCGPSMEEVEPNRLDFAVVDETVGI